MIVQDLPIFMEGKDVIDAFYVLSDNNVREIINVIITINQASKNFDISQYNNCREQLLHLVAHINKFTRSEADYENLYNYLYHGDIHAPFNSWYSIRKASKGRINFQEFISPLKVTKIETSRKSEYSRYIIYLDSPDNSQTTLTVSDCKELINQQFYYKLSLQMAAKLLILLCNGDNDCIEEMRQYKSLQERCNVLVKRKFRFLPEITDKFIYAVKFGIQNKDFNILLKNLSDGKVTEDLILNPSNKVSKFSLIDNKIFITI